MDVRSGLTKIQILATNPQTSFLGILQNQRNLILLHAELRCKAADVKIETRMIGVWLNIVNGKLNADGSGVRLNDGPDIKLFILVGWGRSFFVCCSAHRGSTVGFLLLQCSSGVVRHAGISGCQSQHVVSVDSSSLFHHSIYL